MTTHRTHTIDATDKRLGRVASEAASVLMGKDTSGFTRHVVSPVKVVITGADKLMVEEKKRKQKTYARYSGYPGGQKTETLGHLEGRLGVHEVIRRAVYGMLPANKLRKERMKNLVIES